MCHLKELRGGDGAVGTTFLGTMKPYSGEAFSVAHH